MSTVNLSSPASLELPAFSIPSTSSKSAAVYRVDKFVVPAASLEAFMTRLRYVHAILVDLPGSAQRHILSQIGGDGEFNVVTFLEWADIDAMTAAVAHVQKRFAEDDFDPKKMVADLGIRADQGFYQKA
ncbi:antibiotic biosynthesis monooxygenase [Herbaspirillum sp. NPDC101397]|uniref:antibiotic biosynthesis monooxygenase n=1 Tax=Herbaspirillum sp. NPDC101397 TaxID=3364006 RepID=UPI00383AF055